MATRSKCHRGPNPRVPLPYREVSYWPSDAPDRRTARRVTGSAHGPNSSGLHNHVSLIAHRRRSPARRGGRQCVQALDHRGGSGRFGLRADFGRHRGFQSVRRLSRLSGKGRLGLAHGRRHVRMGRRLPAPQLRDAVALLHHQLGRTPNRRPQRIGRRAIVPHDETCCRITALGEQNPGTEYRLYRQYRLPRC